MINRIFGTLCALAIIAVVVLAALNRGNYSSICLGESHAMVDEVDTLVVEPCEELIQRDTTLAVEVVPGVVE